MKMKIYVLKKDNKSVDVAIGHVVVAGSEQEARNVAGQNAGDETAYVWQKEASIEKLGDYTGRRKKAHLVLTDFKNG